MASTIVLHAFGKARESAEQLKAYNARKCRNLAIAFDGMDPSVKVDASPLVKDDALGFRGWLVRFRIKSGDETDIVFCVRPWIDNAWLASGCNGQLVEIAQFMNLPIGERDTAPSPHVSDRDVIIYDQQAERVLAAIIAAIVTPNFKF